MGSGQPSRRNIPSSATIRHKNANPYAGVVWRRTLSLFRRNFKLRTWTVSSYEMLSKNHSSVFQEWEKQEARECERTNSKSNHASSIVADVTKIRLWLNFTFDRDRGSKGTSNSSDDSRENQSRRRRRPPFGGGSSFTGGDLHCGKNEILRCGNATTRETKRVFRSLAVQKRHCTLQMLHDADHQPLPPPSSRSASTTTTTTRLRHRTHHRSTSTPATEGGLSSSSLLADLVSSYARSCHGKVSLLLLPPRSIVCVNTRTHRVMYREGVLRLRYPSTCILISVYLIGFS